MEQHLLSYYLGVIIMNVNILTLLMGNITDSIARIIAVFNIIGFLMIAYYFMYKEKLL